jgi:exodeoxyribonuclease VII large subunit
LQRRLLTIRIERSSRRLAEVFDRGRTALMQRAGERRRRYDRIGSLLRPEALASKIDAKRRALEAHSKMLISLSYQSVLARGYALVRVADGTMVRRASALAVRDRVEIEFRDGRVGAEITAPATAKPSPSVPLEAKGKQGTLF